MQIFFYNIADNIAAILTSFCSFIVAKPPYEIVTFPMLNKKGQN